LKFVTKLMTVLEEKGLSVFLEQKLAEHVKKIETAFVRFGDNFYQRLKSRLLFSGGERF